MKDRKTLTYVITIVGLIIVLVVLWILIINNFNKNNNNNNWNQGGMNNNSSVEYSSVKEITSNEDITSGTYQSTTTDENVISVSGNVESTLENITVEKSGDSNGGDNTSFYGTNSAIIAKNGATLTQRLKQMQQVQTEYLVMEEVQLPIIHHLIIQQSIYLIQQLQQQRMDQVVS